MRGIDALRTLALSSALILALGGTGCACDEDISDTEPPSAEVSPPAEAPEEAADETSPPAEDTEAAEAEEE